MNKNEYLNRLRQLLSSLSSEECNEAMSYYQQFFEDAGEENEQAVIASLGSPEKLAELIINENINDNDSQNKTSKFNPPETPMQSARKKGKSLTGSQIALIIILLIIGFPIWFSILATLFAVVFGLFIAFVGVTIGIGAAAIVCLCVGLIFIFTNPPIGLLTLGTGFLFAGITALIFIPLFKLAFIIMKSLFKGCVCLFNKLLGRSGARA